MYLVHALQLEKNLFVLKFVISHVLELKYMPQYSQLYIHGSKSGLVGTYTQSLGLGLHPIYEERL